MRKYFVAIAICLFLASPALGMHFLKQSTGVTVKAGPFVDNSDGYTAETGLTISQADVRLSKNGGAFAQKNDANACTHDENGFYGCDLDSTDTGTLGRLRLSIQESGALPVWHEFMVVPSNVYDSLFSTDKLQVDAVEISSDSTAANNAESAFDGIGYGFTNCTMPTTTAVTNTVSANVTQVGGDAIQDNNDGRLEVNVEEIADADVSTTSAQLGVNVVNVGGTAQTANDMSGDVDTILSRVVGTIAAGTHNPQSGDSYARLGAPAGASVSADIAAIEAQTDDIGAAGAGLTAVPWNSSWDAQVESEVNDALIAIDLDHLMHAALPTGPSDMALNSALGHIMDDGTAWSYDRTADSLEVGGGSCPTASQIVDEWESQSQTDPTGFHVNVKEVNGTAQTANDNGAGINAILDDTSAYLDAAITTRSSHAAADVWTVGTRALTDKVGFRLSATGIDDIWDEVITGHATADTFGKVFDDQIDGLRTYGDSNWLTATGFSTHSAADVWSVGTRALTDKAGFSLSAAGIDAIYDELESGHTTAGSFGLHFRRMR